ncbi:hypothetical protein KI387_023740, partial [Taxus chinensis]
ASSVCRKWREAVKQSVAQRERLSFAGRKMDDISLGRLVQGAFCLKELDISRACWACQITDDGLYKISFAKCCSNLTSVSMWGMTGITDNGVLQLTKGLKFTTEKCFIITVFSDEFSVEISKAMENYYAGMPYLMRKTTAFRNVAYGEDFYAGESNLTGETTAVPSAWHLIFFTQRNFQLIGACPSLDALQQWMGSISPIVLDLKSNSQHGYFQVSTHNVGWFFQNGGLYVHNWSPNFNPVEELLQEVP